MDNSQTLNPF